MVPKKSLGTVDFRTFRTFRGGGPGVLNFWGGFGNHFFVLKTSRNATKHKIPSFNMKGDVISDHFLML